MTEQVDDLERRISNERRHIDETLEELEHRLSPRRLLNQAVDYLRHGSASLFGSWGRAMKRNPFPLALTAAGLTMVPALRRHGVPLALTTIGLTMMARSAAGERDLPRATEEDRRQGAQAYESGSDRREHNGGQHKSGNGLLHRARMAAHDLKQQLDETAEAFSARVAHAQGEVLGLARRAGESASEFGARVSHALNEGAQSVRETARHSADAASEMAGSAASAVGHGAHNVKESVMHSAEHARELAHRGREQAGTFLREQPLLALAIGVGFGALLGALLPTTSVERRNIGPLAERARDEVKQKARTLGDTAKRVAGDAVEAVTAGAEQAVHQWEDQGGSNGGRTRSRH